jgi:DNA-directed RNA polymerase subunit RPC12/RpoP
MDALTHIRCPHCGAEVELKPGLLTLKCDYCDNEISLVKPQEETPLNIDFLVPVGVDKNKLTALAHSVMIAPETVPDDILEKSQVEELNFYYVPCYMGSGKFDCHWSASFGFDRQEPYTDYETRFDKGKSYREPVTRYRTVTDWRPASGTGSGKFQRLINAVDSKAVPSNIAEMLQNKVPFQPIVYDQTMMGGYSSYDFVYTPEQGTSALEKMVQNEDATFFAYKRAQGQHQRDWSIDAMVTFDGPIKAGFLPLGKFVFSYNGKNYGIWAEGTSLSSYLTDTLPVDTSRKSKKSKGYIPFWLTLVAVIVSFFLSSSDMVRIDSMIPMGIALLFTFIFGVWRSKAISGFSRRVREASLAGKQLELTDSTSPLTDLERRALLEKSQPPVKPFMARTDRDLKLFLIVLGISCLIFLFSFKYLSPAHLRSGPSSQPQWAEAEKNIDQPTTDSPTNFYDQSVPEPTTDSRSNFYDQSEPEPTSDSHSNSYDQSVPEPPTYSQSDLNSARSETGTQGSETIDSLYNADDINCYGSPPRNCSSSQGLITGLLYRYLDHPGSPKTLSYLGRYKNGLPDGPMIYFNEDSSLNYVDNYREGVPYGLYFSLSEKKDSNSSQSIAILAPVENGQINGTVFSFDEDYNIASTVYYRDGTPNGDSVDYYSDGSVKAKSTYQDGVPVGSRQTYSVGQLREEPPRIDKNDLLNEVLNDVIKMVEEANTLQ